MVNTSTLRNPGVNNCEFIVSSVFATCSVTGGPFVVDVTVQYCPAKRLIEYVEFEKWLRTVATLKPTILEELAVVVLARVEALLGRKVPVHVAVNILASPHCWASVTAQTKNWR